MIISKTNNTGANNWNSTSGRKTRRKDLFNKSKHSPTKLFTTAEPLWEFKRQNQLNLEQESASVAQRRKSSGVGLFTTTELACFTSSSWGGYIPYQENIYLASLARNVAHPSDPRPGNIQPGCLLLNSRASSGIMQLKRCARLLQKLQGSFDSWGSFVPLFQRCDDIIARPCWCVTGFERTAAGRRGFPRSAKFSVWGCPMCR